MLKSTLEKLVGTPEGIRRQEKGIPFLGVTHSVYGLSIAAYLGLNIPLGPERNLIVHCACSESWVRHCATVTPISLPPLTQATSIVLGWSELTEAPQAHNLQSGAKATDLRRQTLSIPLRSRHGETALFFIGVDMPSDEWRRRKNALQLEVSVLANYFHNHMLRICGNSAPDEMLISARELDCLKCIAAGQTAWEASVTLGITERTVRFHLNAAREKMNCVTTTQAVAEAVSRNLIELPLA